MYVVDIRISVSRDIHYSVVVILMCITLLLWCFTFPCDVHHPVMVVLDISLWCASPCIIARFSLYFSFSQLWMKFSLPKKSICKLEFVVKFNRHVCMGTSLLLCTYVCHL